MKYKIKLNSLSAFSPSKALVTEKQNSESYLDFEKRIWKEKAHYDTEGFVIISHYALKAMLDSTASYLSEKIKGKGQSTYSKLFKAGIMIENDPRIMVNDKPLKAENLTEKEYSEWVFCHSDGKRNGTAGRVNRLFPIFRTWSVEFTINILDERITKDVLSRHLIAAGISNGIGRFRPQNAGDLGRFTCELDGKKLS